MIRRTLNPGLFGCLALVACGPTLGEAARDFEGRRRPDGVVVDPRSELPAPVEQGDASQSLVSLKTPVSEKAARKVVATFFVAMADENLPELFSLFTSDAVFRSVRGGTPLPLSEAYRARVQRFDYQALRGARVFDEDRVELYRYGDFDGPLARPLPRPPGMRPSDVALRVPLTTTHSNAGRLFGDEVLFVVRRDGETLRIAEVIEDFLGW